MLQRCILIVLFITNQHAETAKNIYDTWTKIGRIYIYISNKTPELFGKEAEQVCLQMNSTLLLPKDNETMSYLYEALPYEKYFLTGFVGKRTQDCDNLEKILTTNEQVNDGYYCMFTKQSANQSFRWSYEHTVRRPYICQKEEGPNDVTVTTFSTSTSLEITSEILTGSHVPEKVDLFIIAISISLAILIILVFIALIFVLKIKANQKKRKKESRFTMHVTEMSNEDEVGTGTYDSIKNHLSTIEIKQKDTSTTELVTNLILPEILHNTNVKRVPSSQETNKIDEGRYLNEEGLVYVTVNHAQQSVNLTVVNQPDTEENEVVYATVHKPK